MKIHMNLQLFAQPANHTGATGMSAEMKRPLRAKRLLDQAEPLLVHDQFGDKYPIPANNGKTIEFRKYESLPKATEPLTEGVTPNAQALTVTPMTATVKQYGGWAAITDVLQLTAIDNNITQATKVLASQAGRTLDTVTREVLAGGTNVIYAPAGDTAVTSRANLTTASVLTPDLIDQAATALKAQNADAIGESYVAIVHPYVAYDLRRNPEWIDVHKYSTPENIYNGEIGKLAGVRFIETSEAKIWTGDGCPTGLAVFGTLVLAGSRLRRDRGGGRRPAAHRQAAGRRRRPAEPARVCGLEGHQDCGAPVRAVHGAHRERQPEVQREGEGKLRRKILWRLRKRLLRRMPWRTRWRPRRWPRQRPKRRPKRRPKQRTTAW